MAVNDSRTEKSEQLSPKQETLITLMLAGVNINAAAKQAGVAERTAHRWLRNDTFKKAYRAAQHDLFRDAMQELHGLIPKAIKTLERHMTGDETPAGYQIRAAQLILEQAQATDKAGELEDMRDKIARLEQLI